MNLKNTIARYHRLLGIFIAFGTAACGTESANAVRFANESTDTIAISQMLSDATAALSRNATPSERVVYIARQFMDTPYLTGTLESTPEDVTVNLEGMDCTTFVDNVLAMAYTIGEGRMSWRDFTYNLERMRYRGGRMNGYSSRLHYVSAWITDNIHRGIITEVTANLPNVSYEVKNIDFMSRNRDKYPVLSDSTEYARIREMESAYRNHRFPYIKSRNARTACPDLREGDIVAITTRTPGLDVQHMGIVVKVDGEPHLLHASSVENKVAISQYTLDEYLKRNRSATGFRVVRLME